MQETRLARVRLGAFELDLRAGELRQGDRVLRLQDKALRVLEILIEHSGDIATRDEIQKKLWPNDTIVDFDHGINTAIRVLRQALGDSADQPRYIETIAGVGTGSLWQWSGSGSCRLPVVSCQSPLRRLPCHRNCSRQH